MTDPPEVPEGAKAANIVAGTLDPSPAVAGNALAFFMGDEPPPGRDEVIEMAIDFGNPRRKDMRRVVFRSLQNEQFVAAANAARVDDEKAPTGERLDPFTNHSYVFAYACVDPDLGKVLEARRKRRDKTIDGRSFDEIDTAELVREVWRWQPGVLRAVADLLDIESRVNENPASLARLIEAGKDSR